MRFAAHHLTSKTIYSYIDILNIHSVVDGAKQISRPRSGGSFGVNDQSKASLPAAEHVLVVAAQAVPVGIERRGARYGAVL